MKILVTGDWHLDCFKIGKIDPETDLDLRVKDFFNAIDRMIDHAIESKVDLFIMNGDLFKGRTATHHIETLVAERFNKIAAHMKLIINLGNHDYTPKQLAYGIHTYSVLEKLSGTGFSVYTEIEHLQYDGVDIVLYPYYDSKRIDKTNDQINEMIQEKIDSYNLGTESCKLFVGHGTPKGTIINDEFFFNLDVIEEPVLPTSLFEKFDIALFSHIHRAHYIGDKIFHIGSPERVDFSEGKDDKGYVIYDTDERKLNWHSTNPRPMSDIKLNLLNIDEFTDPTEQIINGFANLPDLDKTMIKLSVELSEAAYSQIDHNRIKQELSKVFWYKGPSYSTPKTQQSRIKEVTEQISAVEALEKVLASHEELSDIERKQIMIRGRGILDG